MAKFKLSNSQSCEHHIIQCSRKNSIHSLYSSSGIYFSEHRYSHYWKPYHLIMWTKNIRQNFFSLISFQAAVALKDVTSLTMQSITIQHHNGYGIAAKGLYGYSTMEDCLLVNNTGRDDHSGRYVGGNFV